MGNQNINGLKYCCRHKPIIRLNRDERGYSVVCHQCGRTVDGYDDSFEAIEEWNKIILEKNHVGIQNKS